MSTLLCCQDRRRFDVEWVVFDVKHLLGTPRLVCDSHISTVSAIQCQRWDPESYGTQWDVNWFWCWVRGCQREAFLGEHLVWYVTDTSLQYQQFNGRGLILRYTVGCKLVQGKGAEDVQNITFSSVTLSAGLISAGKLCSNWISTEDSLLSALHQLSLAQLAYLDCRI